MIAAPLAYHITFGTYGTRLHGDSRGTVDRSENHFGEPIIHRNDQWRREELSLLKFPPRELTLEQRLHVQDVLPAICDRGGWHWITTAAATDVRKWVKRWLSQSMPERWPLDPGQVWWAECGSVKWIWLDDYLRRATKYVTDQRAVI